MQPRPPIGNVGPAANGAQSKRRLNQPSNPLVLNRVDPRKARMPMYHAPVPIDADPDAADPAEAIEPTLIETGSEKLRDAHLHNGQIEARALFAP